MWIADCFYHYNPPPPHFVHLCVHFDVLACVCLFFSMLTLAVTVYENEIEQNVKQDVFVRILY